MTGRMIWSSLEGQREKMKRKDEFKYEIKKMIVFQF